METKKAYVIAITVQLIYSGMFLVSKAAFDQGLNSFVFIFYRQATSSLLLLLVAFFLERKNAPSISFRMLVKLFLYALIGNTFTLNLYNIGMKLTSAAVASATSNCLPVVTFCLALLLRMEVVKLRSPSGIAKVAGIALCLAGVLVMVLFIGSGISPINHHRVFPARTSAAPRRADWMKGTFFMVLAVMSLSFWIVQQAVVLKEYPNKMLVTLSQCVFSAVQSFVVAAVAERDFSKWKLQLDISLLAIFYTAFVVNGVSYYLQAWCLEMKGPVFLTLWTPLCLVFTIFCSSFLGETVHLGSIVGGILLVGGLYCVLWGKCKESKTVPTRTVNSSESVEEGHEKKNTETEKDGEEHEEAKSTSMVEQD